MEILIISAFIIITIQSVMLWRMRREADLTRRLRLGYEKQYNTFKLKYKLLAKLEDKDRVSRNVEQLPQPIYLYGGGIIGDKLLAAVKDNGRIQVLRVIEGRELSENPDYGSKLRPELKVIVTPMFDYEEIRRLLSGYFEESSIIGLEEVLQ